MMAQALLLYVALAFVLQVNCYVRVCYYTNWSQYRSGIGKFLPMNIDPFLCTHIVYAFAVIEGGSITPFEWNDAEYDTLYKQVNDLKTTNTNLKVLLAVGGWNHESKAVSPFSQMVSSQSNRKVFIDSAVSLLQRFEFDGLDLDWEYPTQRGNSGPGDRELFTTLCKELKERFDTVKTSSGQSRLILTAAVSAGANTIPVAYETDKLGNYLDILNLMAYDLHGSWDSTIGHHTTLDLTDKLAVTHGLNAWVNGGFPESKIALGLAVYGRSFAVGQDKSLGALSLGAGSPGPYTNEPGYMAYYEVCLKINEGMTVVKDNPAMAPFGYLGNFWVGYEDEESIVYKVRNIIKKRNLKGAMFWALPLDDFTGTICKSKIPFPLMNAVKTELENNAVTTTQTSTLTTTTSKPITTPSTVTMSTTNQTPVTTQSTTKSPTNTTSTTTTKPTTTSSSPTTLTKTQTPVTTKSTTTLLTATTKTPDYSQCFGINDYAFRHDQWCIDNCRAGYCPSTHCSCDPVLRPTTPDYSRCFGINEYAVIYDKWCIDNCRAGYCPSTHCSCDPVLRPTTPIYSQCFGINDYAFIHDQWCIDNCRVGNCPSTHCSCNPALRPTTPDYSQCFGINDYAFIHDQWCINNCRVGNCPSMHCSCDPSMRP